MAHELTDWYEEAERLRVERDVLTARLAERDAQIAALRELLFRISEHIDTLAENDYCTYIGDIPYALDREIKDALSGAVPAPPTTAPLAALVALVAMLRRLEWSDVRVPRRGVRIEQCPICDKQKDGGHAPDCELAALLAALPIPTDIPKTPHGNDGRS
jgi:hypothetical protein